MVFILYTHFTLITCLNFFLYLIMFIHMPSIWNRKQGLIKVPQKFFWMQEYWSIFISHPRPILIVYTILIIIDENKKILKWTNNHFIHFQCNNFTEKKWISLKICLKPFPLFRHYVHNMFHNITPESIIICTSEKTISVFVTNMFFCPNSYNAINLTTKLNLQHFFM